MLPGTRPRRCNRHADEDIDTHAGEVATWTGASSENAKPSKGGDAKPWVYSSVWREDAPADRAMIARLSKEISRVRAASFDVAASDRLD
jgi:hypothetical protein